MPKQRFNLIFISLQLSEMNGAGSVNSNRFCLRTFLKEATVHFLYTLQIHTPNDEIKTKRNAFLTVSNVDAVDEVPTFLLQSQQFFFNNF